MRRILTACLLAGIIALSGCRAGAGVLESPCTGPVMSGIPSVPPPADSG